MLTFDHIAISAATLDQGVAAVESALGVSLAGGGQHPHMATHNRLLGLGDLYLEVIAIDPSLPAPAWPRWFDLDNFRGTPRLTNWVARCENLTGALARSPAGTGVPVALQRNAYRWQMAVPADGKLRGVHDLIVREHGHAGRAPAHVNKRRAKVTQFQDELRSMRQKLSGSEAGFAEARAANEQLRTHLDKALARPARKVTAKRST